jgi:hypothetical protein
VDSSGNESEAITWSRAGPSVPATSGNGFALHRITPNPTRPPARIAFEIPVPTAVNLTIYDIGGRRVRTLIDEFRSAGTHSASWDGRDKNGNRAAAGVYFYRLEAGEHREIRKMAIMH